jgi:bilirubin oxidase
MELALQPGTPLQVPTLVSPPLRNGTRTFELNLERGQLSLEPGRSLDTFGINGPYLAPTLRARRGDKLAFAVANRLGEPTTLHWHGMHLPAAMDGGPHQEIAPGEVWRPHYTVNQQAATLWYHPHGLGSTREHVQRGMVGLFILDDENPAHSALPGTYGVDDFPLILHDSPQGGGTLVNGATSPVITTDRARLRLRVLNATNQQVVSLGLAGGQEFLQIASDGGLLRTANRLTRITLAPAERAEILVDRNEADSAIVVERLGGRAGGDSLLTVNGPVQTPAKPLPAILNSITPLDPAAVAVTRQFALGGRSTINGQQIRSMDDMMDMSSAFRVRLGDVERWDLRNTSRQTHVLHVHDVQFRILSRNGSAPLPGESGLKDSVLMRPGDEASLIMQFADYADSETPYMYHCHVLQHEDQGMMGHFVVVPA